MRRVLIFGNSGSGKSTLAKRLKQREGLEHLDLDALAWLPTRPPERMPISESEKAIRDFIAANDSWAIEGCYADLLELAVPEANELIFLNLSVERCIDNARSRPWEPHKYESREAQDANLDMLINWIAQYPDRTDTFSESAHRSIYDNFRGKKRIYSSNIGNI
ncbi:MAG: AAA family ATPase [Pseudomonadales bacterium]|nr:AAA family ATPase [Halioglobus sp.]MCP5130318.1 AAA family ATPase [Pseudomonadales bacterium]